MDNIDALVSRFRTLVSDMEATASDTSLVEKVKAHRKVQSLLDDLDAWVQKAGLDYSHMYDDLAKLYEQAVIGQDMSVGDEDLKRKIDAILTLTEDVQLAGPIYDLIERYNTTKDKIMESAPTTSQGGHNPNGRYGNTADSYRSDSVRGVKRHLTVTIGKGWQDQGVEVTDNQTAFSEGKANG